MVYAQDPASLCSFALALIRLDRELPRGGQTCFKFLSHIHLASAKVATTVHRGQASEKEYLHFFLSMGRGLQALPSQQLQSRIWPGWAHRSLTPIQGLGLNFFDHPKIHRKRANLGLSRALPGPLPSDSLLLPTKANAVLLYVMQNLR